MGLRSSFRKAMDKLASALIPNHADKTYRTMLGILSEGHGHRYSRLAWSASRDSATPLPWYTYPAIEYFDSLDVKNLKIFEFGSGNSSRYWARKGALVWSVESDPSWHQQISSLSEELSSYKLIEDPSLYAQSINHHDQSFDIVIVDGINRLDCARHAVGKVSASGVIVLDNSDWHPQICDFLRSEGFLQIDFNGFGPINTYSWTTSIFINSQNSVISRKVLSKPIGGITPT